MDLEPEVFKQILQTFQVELEELLQVITEGLLKLEKEDNEQQVIATVEAIFRAAHTIKGAARGVGIQDVGEISHHVESLFCSLQKNKYKTSAALINLCLEAVDGMRLAMQSYLNKTPIAFDLQDLIRRLQQGMVDQETIVANKPEKPAIEKTQDTKKNINDTDDNEIIRVALNQLDQVAALIEEIQINKIAIEDHYLELTQLSSKARQFAQLLKKNKLTIEADDNAYSNFKKIYANNVDMLFELSQGIFQLEKKMRPLTNEVNTLYNSLQEEVRTLRLVPVKSLLCTFPRLVRDLSQDLHKEVVLEVKGSEVKMDKVVLAGLKNPLIHLLRNAIDHGIESPEQRISAGKPEKGHIKIEIIDSSDQVLFILSDDGLGIDVEAIAATAMSKKILTVAELENCKKDDILKLIFKAGFSTKAIITDVSGRGVGLDIVKTNIESLKGTVEVQSELGKGTTFYLRVPLTLSSERGLLVYCAGQQFFIPTNDVGRVLISLEKNIVEVEGRQAIMLDGHPVLLYYLSDILRLKGNEPVHPHLLPVVIVKKDNHSIALLVDDIIGEREIVIKQLSPPLDNVACVAGGTLSSDGQITMVLNTGDVVHAALHAEQIQRIEVENNDGQLMMKPRILVVDDSITTRTLEKNILESKNYDITVAVNGKEAWDLLQASPFSLLITDVNMPIMDGFTLTERVKQSKELSQLPVIIVTSLGSEAEKKRGIEVGANAYIVKSDFESGELLDIVSQLI